MSARAANLAPAFAEPSVLRRAWGELRAIRRYRDLVRYSVLSSLRTENTGTVLGFFWWIVDPLLLMGVYVVFVGVILDRGGPDYPIFVLTALISWEFFSKGTRNAMHTTARKERLMRQVAFPKAVLPLASTLAESVHLVFALVVLVLVAIPFGVLPHAIDLLVLVVAGVQFVFTLGVGFFFATLNVFFRDTAHVLNYLLRFWFFLSPGLYTVEAVPAAWRGVFELNPFATFFPAYRSVLLEHAPPDFVALGLVGVASLAVLALGYLVFVGFEPAFTKVS